MAHPEIIFEYNPIDEDIYIETMRRHGAVILHNYMSEVHADLLAEEIMAHPFEPIDQVHGKVHERFGLREWKAQETTGYLRSVVDRSGEMVRAQGIPWVPTDVRAQLYSPDGQGIDWHIDFKKSLLAVGALTYLGEAQFDVEIGEEVYSDISRPGTLVVLRGTDANPGIDDRPRHRAHAPKKGLRGSIGIRQEQKMTA